MYKIFAKIAVCLLAAGSAEAQYFNYLELRAHGASPGQPGTFKMWSDYSTYRTITPIPTGFQFGGDIRFDAGSTYTIGTSSSRALSVFGDTLNAYSAVRVKNGAKLNMESGSLFTGDLIPDTDATYHVGALNAVTGTGDKRVRLASTEIRNVGIFETTGGYVNADPIFGNWGTTANPFDTIATKEIHLVGGGIEAFRFSQPTGTEMRISSGAGAQIEADVQVVSSTDTQWGFRGSLYPIAVGGNNGDLGYPGGPWRNLNLSNDIVFTTGGGGRILGDSTTSIGNSATPFGVANFNTLYAFNNFELRNTATFRKSSGAVNGYVLTSDGSGYGTWQAVAVCSTCAMTGSSGGGQSLGTSGSRLGTIFINNILANTEIRVQSPGLLNIQPGATTSWPDGNSGISATVTVRNSAGTGTCTMIFSAGGLTGGTC